MDPNTQAEATGGQDIPEKTPEISENPPPIEPPAYKYEEINKAEMSEIARSEPPKEEPKVEPTKEPEVPVEAVARKAAEEVLAQQEAKRLAEEAAKPKEEPQPEDPNLKLAQELWEKEKREPTYTEALNFLKEKAKAELQVEQVQAAQKYQQEQQALQEAKAAEDKQVNAFVDDGLQELYTNNKLTKIADPDNPSDQGVMEKKSLFAKWAEVNTQRRAAGQPEIFDITRIANYYWTKPNAQPAGFNAPVQGSRSATQSDDGRQYTNADLKKPWSFWKRG